MSFRSWMERLVVLGLAGAVFAVMAFGAGYLTLRLLLRGGGVEVPDLTGRPILEALRLSRESDLVLWLDRETGSSDLPRGWVITQQPRPGARVRRGRRISLVVSQGPSSVLVPDLAGASLRLAEATLQRLQLQVGEVLGRGRTDPAAPVAATNPPDGRRVPPDSLVHLLMAQEGAQPVMLPDLSGRLASAARADLAGTGLIVESSGRGEPDRARVADQQPGPGAWLLPGERVTLKLVRPEDTGLGPEQEGDARW